MKFLLDTNVVSEPLAARPSAGVLAGIKAHAAELAISAISWQEMHFGLERLTCRVSSGQELLGNGPCRHFG